MLNLSERGSVFTSSAASLQAPTLPDLMGDAGPAHFGIPEDAASEFEAAESRFDRFRNDASDVCCRLCGRPTGGSVIAGTHVQACDNCLIEWMLSEIGLTKVAIRCEAKHHVQKHCASKHHVSNR